MNNYSKVLLKVTGETFGIISIDRVLFNLIEFEKNVLGTYFKNGKCKYHVILLVSRDENIFSNNAV